MVDKEILKPKPYWREYDPSREDNHSGDRHWTVLLKCTAEKNEPKNNRHKSKGNGNPCCNPSGIWLRGVHCATQIILPARRLGRRRYIGLLSASPTRWTVFARQLRELWRGSAFEQLTALNQNRESRFGARHRPVQRVALHGLPPGFANQPQQLAPPHALAGGGARFVVNLLFHNRAVQIAGAEALRDLRDPGRHHDPVGFDVADVVQHQARDRDHLQIQEPGGSGNMFERRIGRMEGYWNKVLEAHGVA